MNKNKISGKVYLILLIISLSFIIAFLMYGIVRNLKDNASVPFNDIYEFIEKQNTAQGIQTYIVMDKKTNLLYYIVVNGKGISVTPVLNDEGKPMTKDEYFTKD